MFAGKQRSFAAETVVEILVTIEGTTFRNCSCGLRRTCFRHQATGTPVESSGRRLGPGAATGGTNGWPVVIREISGCAVGPSCGMVEQNHTQFARRPSLFCLPRWHREVGALPGCGRVARVLPGPPVGRTGSQLMTFFACSRFLGSDTTSATADQLGGWGLHSRG